MSYLGDAELGERARTSAPGTITANYDGARKHRTTIGERVFLGVDTMLRAPIDDRRRRQDRRRRRRHPRRARRQAGGRRARPGSASRRPEARRRDELGDGARREPARSASSLVIVLLTVLEGFFVAAEIALVSIRRSRVEQLVDEGSRARGASAACSTSPAGSSPSRSSA